MTLKQSEALANKQCKEARGHFQKAAEGYKKGITDSYFPHKKPFETLCFQGFSNLK